MGITLTYLPLPRSILNQSPLSFLLCVSGSFSHPHSHPPTHTHTHFSPSSQSCPFAHSISLGWSLHLQPHCPLSHPLLPRTDYLLILLKSWVVINVSTQSASQALPSRPAKTLHLGVHHFLRGQKPFWNIKYTHPCSLKCASKDLLTYASASSRILLKT